ncbi:MAG: hypothetical protein P4L33_01975 [Capsulimonadaceae bacterium]|nr:hypothetical protein [Capsulimonadaceae bacterium]
MINFKKQDEIVPSAINLASILLMIGTLAFFWLAPNPASNSHAAKRRQMQWQIVDAKNRSSDALEAARPRLWTGDVDTVSADVLGVLTKATVSRSLKLSAFRPQRSVVVGDIVEMPYTVQLSGAYPKIREVARVLDGKGSKIALRSMQVSASGEATNNVTVTLGLSAYVPGDFVTQALADADARKAVATGKAAEGNRLREPAAPPKGAHHA